MTASKTGRVVFPRRVEWLTTASTPRDRWLAVRRQGLGGSDIAAILGESPWASPMTVWLDKTGRTRPTGPSERMRWGTLLEDTVAREWAARDQATIRRLGTVADPAHPWRAASLDRAILVPRTMTAASLLEVKTTGHTAMDLPDTELAARYRWQVQWYLGITGLEWAHVAVLVAGQELRDVRIRFDIDDWQRAAEAADRFWADHVLTDTPPDVTWGDHEALNGWPAEKGGELVAGPDLMELLRLREQLRAEHREMGADLDLLDAAVKAHLGPATELLDPEGRLIGTWREQATTGIDRDAMRADGIYDTYATRGTTRVLRMKKGWDAR